MSNKGVEKSLAGWVFRLEVVTDKPSLLTNEIKTRIATALRGIEDVEMVAIEELFEGIKLFEKKVKA
jgi:hypothetical protein